VTENTAIFEKKIKYVARVGFPNILQPAKPDSENHY